MKASIMSYENGLELYENVRMVRIKSRKYTLLIMEDFAPTLGRIRGNVAVVTDEDEVLYEDILGYFQQKDNVFSLLIGEQRELKARKVGVGAKKAQVYEAEAEEDETYEDGYETEADDEDAYENDKEDEEDKEGMTDE